MSLRPSGDQTGFWHPIDAGSERRPPQPGTGICRRPVPAVAVGLNDGNGPVAHEQTTAIRRVVGRTVVVLSRGDPLQVAAVRGAEGVDAVEAPIDLAKALAGEPRSVRRPGPTEKCQVGINIEWQAEIG